MLSKTTTETLSEVQRQYLSTKNIQTSRRHTIPDKVVDFATTKFYRTPSKEHLKRTSSDLKPINEIKNEENDDSDNERERAETDTEKILSSRTIVHFQTFFKNSLMILHETLSDNFLDELRDITKVSVSKKNSLGHLNISGSEQQVALARFMIQEEVIKNF